ncbi:MAG: cytochrome c oxidase subunit I [SAR202 cluster bacterium]|nr:cytochrome c oxidase subunit I [Chloroflexota bacterium]MQG22359.1 cytochrome c oxidase subunit I [SAR202 cluster bacterium]
MTTKPATKSLVFPRFFPRPNSKTGIWSWIATVDHKKIGTLYGITSFFWFIVAGLEALLIRIQLSQANNDFLSPDMYNSLFTMHGTTMIFLVVMPLSAAFFNWLIPLQIGARDVAFPRLNALSYWIFLFGSILINFSWITGEAPNGGWFGYAPNSGVTFNPGKGMTYWVVGLNVLGISSIAAGLNFVTTIINMRAPGMSMFKMPIFTWMTLVTSILIILALPILAVAGIQLQTDRIYGTHFFNSLGGGDPVMWQHIFWLFGHPEVYILILPAMGIVSEVLPTFARKPIFGYSFVVFAGAIIGFMGWFVWSHHMFTVGLGPAANSAFSISTMLIAVPTGIKIFNWLGTLWGGSIRFNTAMLFSLGFIAMFTIGGLSGVMHASPPTDAQQQDTYFVVAHFHYVLFGGALLGIFSGIYFWWPKFTGYFLNEKIGKLNFIFMLVGFNIQFGPMHWLGMDGMPRRIYTYAENMGWEGSNLAATIGGFILGIGVLLFIYNVIYSMIHKEVAGADPWDGRTLEWSTSSPPPEHDFDEIPQVKFRDDFWFKKYPETIKEYYEHGEIEEDTEDKLSEKSNHEDEIHLPDMSYYPFILGVGIAILGAGFLSNIYIIAISVPIMIWGMLGWSMEPVNDPHPDNH